jgi:hypothetical protein
MIRVLTPIAIALFFIGYPPFHRLRSPKSRSCFEAFDISRSFSSAVPHALDGAQISAAHAGVAKLVAGCNPRAEEKSGLGGLELIRMSAFFPSSLCMRFSLPVMIGQKVSIAP